MKKETPPERDEYKQDTGPCPKGGLHEWGIDGAHSNEFCRKCFIPSPAELKRRERRAKQ